MTKPKAHQLTKVYFEATTLTASHVSGVGRVVLNTLKALEGYSPDGYEIILVVPYDTRRKLELYGFGFRVKTLPIPDKAFRALRKYNLLPPLDLLLGKGVYVFPNYWNWPVLQSKSLTYVYDLGFLTHPEFVETRNKRFLASNIHRWLKRTDTIVTDSRYVRDEIEASIPIRNQQIVVVPNGVKIRRREPNTDGERAKLRQYGVNTEYLLFVGNIEPRKNLSRLIEAYSHLPEVLHQKYSLVLVGGDGWNNAGILQDIEQAQRDNLRIIRIEQFVPDSDLPTFYRQATLLVHPALYEGFGLTPLEAMAYGTPVVVARNSAIPEVVGEAGLYCDAKNVKDISDKIEQVLMDNSLRKKLSEQGKLRARQFTWDKTAEALIGAIQGVVTKRI